LPGSKKIRMKGRRKLQGGNECGAAGLPPQRKKQQQQRRSRRGEKENGNRDGERPSSCPEGGRCGLRRKKDRLRQIGKGTDQFSKKRFARRRKGPCAMGKGKRIDAVVGKWDFPIMTVRIKKEERCHAHSRKRGKRYEKEIEKKRNQRGHARKKSAV